MNQELTAATNEPWTEGNVAVNGIRLHYTRTGGAKPALVMCHGFSDNGLCWSRVATELAPDYDVVMVDARGHGLSEAPESGYNSLEHAADIAGVIEGLGLHKPIVLGHSMGAVTALVLAGTYPDLPGAILLEDPPAMWEPKEDAPPTPATPSSANDERKTRMQKQFADMKSQTLEELVGKQRGSTPFWPDSELVPWAQSKQQLSFNILNRETSPAVNGEELARKITCPALLIIGDKEKGAIVSEADAAVLQRLAPHVQVAHIPNAGHSIRRDQFKPYMEAVRTFLADLPAQTS